MRGKPPSNARISELETLRTDRIPSARRAVDTSHAAFRNPSPWKITATLARKQETSVTVPPSLVLSKTGIDGSPRSPTPTGRPLIGSFKTDSTTRTPRTWMIAKPRCSRFLRTWSSIRRSRATTDSSMRLWPGSTDTKRDAKPAIPWRRMTEARPAQSACPTSSPPRPRCFSRLESACHCSRASHPTNGSRCHSTAWEPWVRPSPDSRSTKVARYPSPNPTINEQPHCTNSDTPRTSQN